MIAGVVVVVITIVVAVDGEQSKARGFLREVDGAVQPLHVLQYCTTIASMKQ